MKSGMVRATLFEQILLYRFTSNSATQQLKLSEPKRFFFSL